MADLAGLRGEYDAIAKRLEAAGSAAAPVREIVKRDIIAFFKLFHFPNKHFERNKIKPIFGKKGCCKIRIANANLYWNHTPAIG